MEDFMTTIVIENFLLYYSCKTVKYFSNKNFSNKNK